MSKLYTQDGGLSMVPVMGGMIALIMIGLVSSLTKGATAGTSLTGIVSDPKTEQFVEGALVTLDGGNTGTDIVGYYAFTNLSPGAYSLTFSKAGYETKTLPVTLTQGENTINVALAPEIIVEGRASLTGIVWGLIYSDSAITASPLRGALVKLDASEVTTDEHGAFLLENLEPGAYHLTVTREDYSDYDSYVTLVEGDNTETIVLVPVSVAEVTLQCAVVDATSGIPIDSASATLDGYAGTTDSQGSFSLTVTPGRYLLTITREGYEGYTNLLDLFSDLTIQVAMAPLGAEFEASDLVIEPSVASVGQIVEISATITNTGDAPDTYIVNCEILAPGAGQPGVERQEVTLASGQSQRVIFTVSPNVVGDYQVSVDGLSASLIALAAGPLPEDFELDYLLADPPVITLGGTVTLYGWWYCPNPGLAERTFTLLCEVNGETLSTTWGPTTDGNGWVEFYWTPESSGDYTAACLDKSATIDVRPVEAEGIYYSPFGEICRGIDTCESGLTAYATLNDLADRMASSIRESYGGLWDSVRVGGAGRSSDVIRCPYCSAYFTACTRSLGLSCSHSQRVGASFALLDHIQEVHPDYPLTVPRCHVIVDNIPDLLGGEFRPSPLYCYAVRIDDATIHYNTPYWQAIGYRIVVDMGPGGYEYEERREFVITPGQHHVEIRGPVEKGYEWRAQDPYDTPSTFDKLIDLASLGDKVIFNMETGVVSTVDWPW